MCDDAERGMLFVAKNLQRKPPVRKESIKQMQNQGNLLVGADGRAVAAMLSGMLGYDTADARMVGRKPL